MLVEELRKNNKLMEAIENTLNKLVSIIESSDALPTKEGDPDYIIDFFHGISGVIPLFTLAMEVYPKMENKFIQAAHKAGQITWKQGFLMHGTGLGQGFTGNGYALHSLYRAFLRQKDISMDHTEK
jgi:hypothetical protein